MKTSRVYYHYEQLEEFHAGMWKIVRGEMRKRYIELAANLMRDATAFKDAMLRAVREWPKSCEFNFTSDSVNRIAWLGHAGCCLGVGSPEEATRCGWHTLNQHEQDIANQVAAEALSTWEAAYYMVSHVTQLELFDGA
jgi:hypothetical protein